MRAGLSSQRGGNRFQQETKQLSYTRKFINGGSRNINQNQYVTAVPPFKQEDLRMNTGQDNFYTIGNKETAESRNQQTISNGGDKFTIEHRPRVKTANGMRKSKKVL